MNKTRILIVDDHKLFSSGLAMLLNAEQDLEVIGQVDNPANALRLAGSHHPDIVLLDITLAEKSGLDLLPEILLVSPRSHVIILTMHEEQQYLKKAVADGAKGFVLKKGVDIDLLYAIRAVKRGELYIQPSMLKGFMQEGKQNREEEKLSEDERLWRLLSHREQDVLIAVARGLTGREIAEKNFLSEKTVATYRARGMAKLGIKTRAELVELVVRLKKMNE